MGYNGKVKGNLKCLRQLILLKALHLLILFKNLPEPGIKLKMQK